MNLTERARKRRCTSDCGIQPAVSFSRNVESRREQTMNTTFKFPFRLKAVTLFRLHGLILTQKHTLQPRHTCVQTSIRVKLCLSCRHRGHANDSSSADSENDPPIWFDARRSVEMASRILRVLWIEETSVQSHGRDSEDLSDISGQVTTGLATFQLRVMRKELPEFQDSSQWCPSRGLVIRDISLPSELAVYSCSVPIRILLILLINH